MLLLHQSNTFINRLNNMFVFFGIIHSIYHQLFCFFLRTTFIEFKYFIAKYFLCIFFFYYYSFKFFLKYIHFYKYTCAINFEPSRSAFSSISFPFPIDTKEFQYIFNRFCFFFVQYRQNVMRGISIEEDTNKNKSI